MGVREEKELQRLLKIACYERDDLQRRLDDLREAKDEIVRLLEKPTMQERIEAAGPKVDIFTLMGSKP